MKPSNTRMKFDKRFPLQVAAVLMAGLIIGSIPAANAGGDAVVALVVGAMLSAANVLAGFIAIEYSFDKSHATFLKAVLGGMGIRLIVMLGLIVLLIRAASLSAAPLVISVLAFYVMFLVLEVLYIQRKVSQRHLHQS